MALQTPLMLDPLLATILMTMTQMIDVFLVTIAQIIDVLRETMTRIINATVTLLATIARIINTLLATMTTTQMINMLLVTTTQIILDAIMMMAPALEVLTATMVWITIGCLKVQAPIAEQTHLPTVQTLKVPTFQGMLED